MKKFLDEENTKLNKNDYLTLLVIIFSYACLSFINLGSFKNPNTFLHLSKKDNLIIKIPSNEQINKIKIFDGCESSSFIIYDKKSDKDYSFIIDIKGNGAFAWTEEETIINANTLEIEFKKDTDLGEIAFYNNNKLIPTKVYYKGKEIKTLTDEKKLITKEINYLNSTYFDEIYFARAAYEYAKGLKPNEWVHPPLGKIIESIPIYITNNMSPFNYRLMSNISGIMMLIIIYLIAKLLFKKRKYAIISSLLLAFDTFHLVETRIGTIDVHLILFSMLSIYFMLKFTYYTKDKDLLISGLFISFAISTKWIGLYVGISLAIIYITNLIKKDKINFHYFKKGLLYFIFIPTIIYFSIYLIYPNNRVTYTNTIPKVIEQQKAVYNYHSNLKAKHPFSSPWYSWPISYRPVWYYNNEVSKNERGTITLIGNIIIWWFGIISFIYLIIKLYKKKDQTSFHLLVIILSVFLPFSFISRDMFLYHYYIVLPFLILSIVNLLKDITNKYKNNYFTISYLIIVIIFFIIYYPVITGIPINSDYIEKLRLFSSWYF